MRTMVLVMSIALLAVAVWVWLPNQQATGTGGTGEGGGGAGGKGERVAAVEVGAIERGEMEDVRIFSGTLESPGTFVVSPKISGRIERITVNLSDPVEQGSVVAVLDDDEYQQAVRQAEADRAVAQANLHEATSRLTIARREMGRITTLKERGVASESQADTVEADVLAREANEAVARAQVARAEAALEAARIRLSYTQVTANWTRGSATRIVAERFAEAGDTVAANDPLLSIVELDRLLAVVFVAERDYALMHPGQAVRVTTDAFPHREFEAKVLRIAPVFRQASRQARVEVELENPDHALKPGLFIRARVVLGRVADAVIVPEAALTRRGESDGVFVLDESGQRVHWRPVTVGLRRGGRVEVRGEGLVGQVVTLGQQLVSDGSRVTIPESDARSGEPRISEGAGEAGEAGEPGEPGVSTR